MAYSLKHSDGSVGAGLRRIAADQLDRGIAALSSPDDLHDAVHDARKRVKKLRGLLRLVRPSIGIYSAENAYLRDAARLVSGLRDSAAQMEALERLARDCDLDRHDIAPLRKRLKAQRDHAERASDLPDRLAAFRAALETSRAHLKRWEPDADGFNAVAGGLGKTYRRARKGMKAARGGATPEAMHEWRKRVKYHWYHARLLERIWPQKMAPHIAAADELAEMLGDHHDLAVLRGALEDAGLSKAVARRLDAAATARMDALADEAFGLGARLLADKPDALIRRWRLWWDHWAAD